MSHFNTKMQYSLPALLVSAVLSGCSVSINGIDPTDSSTQTDGSSLSSVTQVLAITSTSPSAGGTNISPMITIDINFNATLKPTTVSNNTFTVRNGSGAVAGEVTYTDKIATFVPDASLSPEETYEVVVAGGTAGVQSDSGATLTDDYTFSFSTASTDGSVAGAPSTTETVGSGDVINDSYSIANQAPTVSSTTPTLGAADVYTRTPIEILFSESLDASSLTNSTVAINGASGVVPGTINFSGTMLSITPNNALEYSSTYTVTLVGGTSGIKDLNGEALAADYNFSFTTRTAGTGSAAPVVGHPRIWLDSTTLTRLGQAAQAGSSEWTTMRNTCDSRIGQTVPTWEYQGAQSFRWAVGFSLCYQVAKQIGDSNANTYAAEALRVVKDNLLPFTNYSRDSGFGIRNYGPGLAIAYDWIYDYAGFDDATKTAVRDRLKAWLDWYAASGYSRDEPIANYHTGYMLAGVLAGIAMYGEDAEGTQRFYDGVALYDDGVLAFDNAMPGGHWPEGWSYGTGVYERYAMAAAALKSATNDGDYTRSQWIENNIALKLNAVTPDGQYFYDDGLWSRDRHGVPTQNDMFAAGFLFGWDSPQGQRVRRYLDNLTATETVDEWRTMLFTDPNATAVAATSVESAYHAVGSGLTLMRANRSEADATWASFIAGPYISYEREQDMDQGNIQLYKGAPLLVDAGHGLYSNDQLNATIHHNTYTLEGRTGFTFNGQRQYAATAGCPNDPIGIDDFQDGNDWVFSSGEFANAYRPAPVWTGECLSPGIARLNRNMFYVRPGLFFVYDQIEELPEETQVAPHMHLNFPNQPTAADATNRQLTMDNGTARLQVATVYPVDSVSSLGSNASLSPTPAVAAWHLDVTGPDNSIGYNRFLNVLRAGNTGDSFPTITRVGGTEAYGAKVTGLNALEASGAIVAVFADNGTTTAPSSISYTVDTLDAGDTHYILKLKKNTEYVVTVTTGASNTVTVTEGTGTNAVRTNGVGMLTYIR